MEDDQGLINLFNIAKEIKLSLETPVVLFTKKDYNDKVYKLLLDMRHLLIIGGEQQGMLDLVIGYHYDWLTVVKDIKTLKQRIRDIPREVFYECVDFTIKSVKNRCDIFKNYVLCTQNTLSVSDRSKLQTDIELIEDMQESVIAVLQEKKIFLANHADTTEFIIKLEYEIDELLNWWDKLNDNLSNLFSNTIVDIPLNSELAKTLKSVVDDFADVSSPTILSTLNVKQSGDEILCSMLRVDTTHDLEIKKVVEKINVLDDRIERLKDGSSAAVMALQHKRLYLMERLRSLENMKISIQKLQSAFSNTTVQSLGEPFASNPNKEYRIFNHMLPIDACQRLVTKLVLVWESALQTWHHRKSVITILSAGDIKEEFSDYLGVYSIDKHGRKIYEKVGTDDLFQTNERNELVPVSDDEKHVYFYDTVGRYYLHNSKRVYKATLTASEYILHPTEGMLKLKETVDGIEYHFDNVGRYYINENAKQIYLLNNTGVEYENDGFGNLIAINDTEYRIKCPPIGPMVNSSNKYLKKVVGDALKKCLLDIVLYQPPDPILHLAKSLEKYRENTLFKEKHDADLVEMILTRQNIKDEENIQASTTAYSLATHMDETSYEHRDSTNDGSTY